jgi:hypothetical protein
MATLKLGSTTAISESSGAITIPNITSGTIGTGVTLSGQTWQKIGSATFSDSSLVILGQNLGSYRIHKLYVYSKPATTNGSLNLNLRVKIGDTWNESNEYCWVTKYLRSNSGTLTTNYTNDAVDYYKLTFDSARSDNHVCSSIEFHNAVSARHTAINAETVGLNHDGDKRMIGGVVHGMLVNNGVVNDIRIWPQSSTISGGWELYGIL